MRDGGRCREGEGGGAREVHETMIIIRICALGVRQQWKQGMEGNQFLNVHISYPLLFLHSAFAALAPLRLCWYVTTVAKSFPQPTLPFLPSLEGILSDL